MRRSLFILILVCFSISISSASNLHTFIHEITGTWSWQSSTGGFAGVTLTPATEGPHTLLIFQTSADSAAASISFKYYRDDSLLHSGLTGFHFDMWGPDSTWFADSNMLYPTININNTPIVTFNDSMFIDDNIGDGFTHFFVRDSLVSSIPTIRNFSFTAYPNPASNFINLSPVNSKATISIINSYGKLLYQEQLNQKMIDISSFASGLYMIRLNVHGKVADKKIIIR